jgi:transcription initiation factor TFIIIB Brf1 subunit/transcription initiation factor TFIIB
MTITCPKCNKDIREEDVEANKAYCSSCKKWFGIKANLAMENSRVIKAYSKKNITKSLLLYCVCISIGAIMAVVSGIFGLHLLVFDTTIAIMCTLIFLRALIGVIKATKILINGTGKKGDGKYLVIGIFQVAFLGLLFFLFSLPLAKDFVFVINTAPHVTAAAYTSTIQRTVSARGNSSFFSIRSQHNIVIRISGGQYRRLQSLRGSRITAYYLPNTRILLKYSVIE